MSDTEFNETLRAVLAYFNLEKTEEVEVEEEKAPVCELADWINEGLGK